MKREVLRSEVAPHVGCGKTFFVRKLSNFIGDSAWLISKLNFHKDMPLFCVESPGDTTLRWSILYTKSLKIGFPKMTPPLFVNYVKINRFVLHVLSKNADRKLMRDNHRVTSKKF